MSTINIILLGVIAGFALFGFSFGVIATLGSLVGTIIGAFFASRWYEAPAIWIHAFTGWSDNASKVIAFIIIFVIINRLVGFVFYLLDHSFGLVLKLPVISGINRLLGALVGLVEGVVAIGLAMLIISRFPLNQELMAALNQSSVAAFCAGASSLLWPLVPDAIRALQNALQNIIH